MHRYVIQRVHETDLFQGELKLGCVQQKLEEDLGVVLGIVDHLVFDLAHALVVQVIGYMKKKEEKTKT